MGGIMLANYGLTGTIPLPVGNSDPRVRAARRLPGRRRRPVGRESAVWSDEEWRSLCATLGNFPTRARDQFETRESRVAGREDVNKLVAEATAQRERDELQPSPSEPRLVVHPRASIAMRRSACRVFVARGSWIPLTHPIRRGNCW